ncbi:MAG: hypothetical protein ABMA64_20785 [Myxococcota bacterium]
MTRDDLRAALIALALLGHGVYALPLPDAISDEALASEAGQRDLALWHDALASVGVQVDRDALGAFAQDASRATSRLHRAMKVPFRPLFDLVGVNQAWALFASATTAPDRLVVEIERPGSPGWEKVLRRLDPCCTWLEPVIEYRRVRGVWDGQSGRMRPGYKGLARWLADRAFEAFPDATAVRVRLERAHEVYPWEPPDDRVESVHERTFVRPPPAPSGPR